MKYELKRPCAKCPFRYDVGGYLTGERMEEIVEAIRDGETFTCHNTVDYEGWDEEEEYIPSEKDQHCAGALIFLEHLGELAAGQLTRIAMRIGMFDPDALDMSAPVFDDPHVLIEHHAHSDPPYPRVDEKQMTE